MKKKLFKLLSVIIVKQKSIIEEIENLEKTTGNRTTNATGIFEKNIQSNKMILMLLEKAKETCEMKWSDNNANTD